MSSADFSTLKSSALIVGGDQIEGIKRALTHYGGNHAVAIHDLSTGPVIDMIYIVLITNWISHSIIYKVKKNAMKRGIKVIYTPNGSASLRNRLNHIESEEISEADHAFQYH